LALVLACGDSTRKSRGEKGREVYFTKTIQSAISINIAVIDWNPSSLQKAY
jgi:hypothetical protein